MASNSATRNVKTVLLRALLLTHRYLGIAVGWLLLMWCVSGVVMMYVGYPLLSASERHASLATLKITRCCKLSNEVFAADQAIGAFRVEMLAGTPVLRVEPDFGAPQLIDLQTGLVRDEFTAGDALSVARDYINQHSKSTAVTPTLLGLIDHDQWTVYGDEDQRPLFHLALDDTQRTQLYVSSVSGALVQKTTRPQRFWNWLGAVPHWLYLTQLRERVALWTHVIVWSSVLGSFLAALGLGLGVWQLRRSDGQLHSPYRGWKYWHHVPGLVFGLMVLTWVVSGLLSMNPWGWLETQGAARDARQIQGRPPTWSRVREVIEQLPQARLATNTVALDATVLQGKLFVVASTRNDAHTRFDSTWRLAPLRDTDINQVATLLSTNAVTSGAFTRSKPNVQLLTQPDAYYYNQAQQRASLPVWRVALSDVQATRYYLDPITGNLLSKVDDNARWYRWLHSGLHRMDFNSLLRSRPLWDLWMWLLLSGATVTCGTGTWLAVKHLRGK